MSDVATVPLALDDFVPVLLAGAGAIWLACSTRRSPAVIGALLILAGGLCKATWKLLLALTGDDVPWVDDLLFVLLAPGFALLAWGLIRRDLPLALPVALSVGAGALALAVQSTVPLLILVVIASTATGVLALLRARAVNDSLAAVMFATQLTMAYALVPLAGSGQLITHQWWEQSLNTVGQAAFAIGGWRLLQHARTRSNEIRSNA